MAVPPPCVPHMAEADATKATRRSDLSIMFVRYVYVEVCAYTARAWRGVNAHDHTEGRARVGECPSSSRALGNSECRDLKPATRTDIYPGAVIGASSILGGITIQYTV